MKPLRIALALPWLNDGTHKNFIGDHGMACAWQKYLLRRPDVACVDVLQSSVQHTHTETHDIVIHFWPGNEPWHSVHIKVKNILYLQSALGPEFHPDGTVGVFNEVKGRFDGHMFVSEKLKERCGAEGAVVPFSADSEAFTYQPDERFAHPVSFVGSDIRGDAANERYLVPARRNGLVIYGGPYRDPRLQAAHRGRLSAEDLPKVFSSSRVNLNITHPEHVKNGVINERVYQVLACGGAVLSDGVIGLTDSHTNYLPLPDGHDWAGGIAKAVNINPSPETIAHRREMIMSGHTTAHRVETVMQYLKELL